MFHPLTKVLMSSSETVPKQDSLHVPHIPDLGMVGIIWSAMKEYGCIFVAKQSLMIHDSEC